MKVIVDNMGQGSGRAETTFDVDPQSGDLVSLDAVHPVDTNTSIGYAPKPPTINTASMTSKKGVRSAVMTVKWPLYRGSDAAVGPEAVEDPGFAQVQLKVSLPNTAGCRPAVQGDGSQSDKNAKALACALSTLLALVCDQKDQLLYDGNNPFQWKTYGGVFASPDSVLVRGMAGVIPLNALTESKKLSDHISE